MSDNDPQAPTPNPTPAYVVELNTEAWAAITAIYHGNRGEAWRIVFENYSRLPDLCVSTLSMCVALLRDTGQEKAERTIRETGLWLAQQATAEGGDGDGV